LERFDDVKTGELVVAVTFEGARHERRLDPRVDRDARDLRIAQSFMRHRDIILSKETVDRAVVAAADVDYCIAVERLFPRLIGRLPR